MVTSEEKQIGVAEVKVNHYNSKNCSGMNAFFVARGASDANAKRKITELEELEKKSPGSVFTAHVDGKIAGCIVQKGINRHWWQVALAKNNCGADVCGKLTSVAQEQLQGGRIIVSQLQI